MDNRIRKINKLLIRYSTGDFNARLKLSDKFDETDALIAGINMLGEELKETTISRNYFNDIFHSVADIAIVINHKGIIQDTNAAAVGLGYTRNALFNKHIDKLQREGQKSLFAQINTLLREKVMPAAFQAWLHSYEGQRIPVTIVITPLQSNNHKQKNILLMIKDISEQLKTENVVIRTIIDTQEQERVRLAKDMHDSLGQQLSAIKFFIGTAVSMATDEQQRLLLEKSNLSLVRMLADMRNICFNLAPRTLDEFGLIKAVKELCTQIDTEGKIKFQVRHSDNFPTLTKSIEVDIFRIIQEFTNNSIKYSNCTKILMSFECSSTHVSILLKDNGQGFDINNVCPAAGSGMGLQNVRSRARSHNIVLDMESKIGKGTTYRLIKTITDDETTL